MKFIRRTRNNGKRNGNMHWGENSKELQQPQWKKKNRFGIQFTPFTSDKLNIID